MQDLIKLPYGTEAELKAHLKHREIGVATDKKLKPLVGHGNGNATGIVTDEELVQQLIGATETPSIIVAELASRLRGLQFELERMNKQALMQGQAMILGGTHNGYFRATQAFTTISFGGFGQKNAPNYEVLLTPVSGDLAIIGNLVAYDKTQNGFKVKMTGSAVSVTFIWTLINKLN